MIKAIFLDVDGTLISFKTHRVPASALDALREAHARGVQLFIATGRAAADLADLEAIPYDGVAALNGALTSVFTPLSAVSFLVFTLLYTPCVAAVATIRRELDSRLKTIGVVLMQCGVAWIAGFFVYQIGSLL